MADENTTEKSAETQEVTDLDTFVRLLVGWHGKRVKRLEEILMTPEGTEVTLGEGEPFILKDDALKGFRVGVALSLSQLGHLPFSAEMEGVSDGNPPVQH